MEKAEDATTRKMIICLAPAFQKEALFSYPQKGGSVYGGVPCRENEGLYHELSDQLKGIEKRMSEATALRRHIINYMKTREVYVAYRKVGYSQKFLAEHESDILIHKAAKEAFDELHLEKLPTIRSLQNEYAQLESEKKQVFAAYRQAKEDMRKLLTAKANVDQMFGYDTQRTEKNRDSNTPSLFR